MVLQRKEQVEEVLKQQKEVGDLTRLSVRLVAVGDFVFLICQQIEAKQMKTLAAKVEQSKKFGLEEVSENLTAFPRCF